MGVNGPPPPGARRPPPSPPPPPPGKGAPRATVAAGATRADGDDSGLAAFALLWLLGR